MAALKASIEAAAQHGTCAVWPQHWHALQVFQGMGTQWRVVAGLAGLMYMGLDYGGLRIVLAENRRVPHRQPFERLMPQLRQMELSARAELNGS